jgi:HEAT repeat protein
VIHMLWWTVRQLNSKNPNTRFRAVQKLVLSEKVEALIDALDHEEGSVAALVAEGLGRIGDPRAVEPLIVKGLGRNSVVSKAAEALGKIGDRRAVKRLLEVLDTANRWDARNALLAIGDPAGLRPAINALLQEYGRNETHLSDSVGLKADAERLRKAGKAVTDLLLEAMKDITIHSKPYKVDSHETFKHYKRTVAAALLDCLGWKPADDVEWTYWFIAHEYHTTSDRTYWYRCTELSAAAVEVLISYRDTHPPDLYRHPNVNILLAYIEGEQRLNALLARAEEGDHQAVEALGGINDDRIFQALIKALGHQDKLVRQAAAIGLSKIKVARFKRAVTENALNESADQAAVRPLIAALGDNEHIVRRAAVEALGEIGDERTKEPVAELLNDPNGDVREAAAKVLRKFGDGRVA